MEQPPDRIEIAVHGIGQLVPHTWDVVATYGDWRRGQVLFAEDRRPRLSLSWQRHAAAPDLARTLRGAGKSIVADHPHSVPAGDEALGSDGLLARWSSPGAPVLAAVRRIGTATLVWRQLGADTPCPMRAIADSAWAVADDAPARWRVHGLELDLPAWWRLEGLSRVPGLARGAWAHRPGGSWRADQILVMRRLACASRILPGLDPAPWLRQHLARDEQIVAEESGDGAARLRLSRPGRTWWQRLRGQRATRELHAWVETAADRVVVQEWIGAGEPLPGLRPRSLSQHGAVTSRGRDCV